MGAAGWSPTDTRVRLHALKQWGSHNCHSVAAPCPEWPKGLCRRTTRPETELVYMGGGVPASDSLGVTVCVQREGDRLLTRPCSVRPRPSTTFPSGCRGKRGQSTAEPTLGVRGLVSAADLPVADHDPGRAVQAHQHRQAAGRGVVDVDTLAQLPVLAGGGQDWGAVVGGPLAGHLSAAFSGSRPWAWRSAAMRLMTVAAKYGSRIRSSGTLWPLRSSVFMLLSPSGWGGWWGAGRPGVRRGAGPPGRRRPARGRGGA
jgi:hypothetical protein